MMDDEPQAAEPKQEIIEEEEEEEDVDQYSPRSPIPRIFRTKNENLTHLLFAKEEVGSEKKDSAIIEKLAEQFQEENQGTIEACSILAEIGVDRIKQMVLGPRHVAFLLDDDNVIRLGYESSKVKDIPVMQECSEIASTMSQSAQQAAAAALQQQQSARTSGIAKYRRVMLGGRSYCRLRTGTGSEARGVIIGRPSGASQNIPVPEELINNVQQVLQGKSREIIIRELQRTGLNVNEAVNNLLSRDDGDDPMDMSGADPILPEELLQLLEHSSAAIGGHPLDDPFEALNFSRLTKKRELKNEKKKEQAEMYRSTFRLSQHVEWWSGREGAGKPREVAIMDDPEPIVDEERMLELEREKRKFSPIVSITCTTWALYALHKNGKIYTWNWDDEFGSEHEFIPEKIAVENAPVVMITSSNLRICAILQNGAMISWLENLAVGRRVQKATESYGQIPVEQIGLLKDFTTSDYIAAVRCENVIYWCGIYPPSDRSKSTEKSAEKSEKDRKKHVSFGETSISSTTSNSASSGLNSASGSSEIQIGSQVQLKKSPIFPAGSVGVFIDTEKPMIGVLLEDSWNFGENCRFRILSVEEYDAESVKMEILEEEEDQYVQPNQSRKRKATEPLIDPFHDHPVQRIEIWPIDEVLWIHEHRKRDVMTVEVVDNQMVAVKFNETSRNCMKYASLISDNPEGTLRIQPGNQGMRILRKDELQVIKNPAKNEGKLTKLVQKEVLSFMIDMSKPIISMCADLTGFRILVRSRHDQMLLCKVPVTGKVVTRSRLPLNALAVEKRILRGGEGKCPELVNFGDSRTLFIRDSAGQLIPLLRDALNGYREPQILHSQPINLISTYSRPKGRNGAICEKGASAWEGSVLCIPGTNRPNHRHFLKDFASLMQLILYCDLHGVQAFLNKINDLRQSSILTQDEFRQIMSEQLFAITSDGCSNIIHAAIRLCVAAKNSQNQDKITPENLTTPPKFAAKNEENEKRWKGVLRGRRRSQEIAEEDQEIEENMGETVVLASGTVVEDFSMGHAIKTPEMRQKNAMGILDLLLKHLTMFFDIDAENGVAFLDEKDRCSALKALLSARDINGRTPFMLAVNLRAYGAAGSVWQCLLQLGFADMNNYEQMQYIYPPVNDDPATIFSLAVSYQSPPDDSPLFVLCYNDVCSFTWTGAEHINQDIYECRTCGITGSFCCCSECAISCHRNHDCKIKKSCPTAYCDCWQKCGCKSLINGNEKMREYLFVQLLKHTELYELANSRGEHLMLFLAKTVIRQYREQNGFQAKKKSSRANRQDLEGLTPPEHDLSAPRFAKFAMEQCCKKPEVVKSAINLGAIELDWEMPMSRNDVFFNTQSSAVHLDRLTFTLMNKRVKEYTVAIINTLRAELSSGKENRDPHVEKYTSRFVRSIIRVLVLAINVSPIAASIIMSGEEIEHTSSSASSANSGSSSSFARETIRFSNLISLNAMGIIPVSSKKEHQKDKSSQMISFVSRIIAILRSLPVFAILELAQAADSIFSPVRFGLARPIQSPILSSSTSDPIDVMEKYFSSDVTFEEVLKKARREEMKQEKRVRRNSRRDQSDRDRTESERRDSSNDQDEESQDGLSRNSTGNRGVRRTRTRNVSIPEENPQEINQREPDDETVRDADNEMEEEEEDNEEEEDEEEEEEEEETVRDGEEGETQRDETVRFINDEDEEDEEEEDDDDDEEENEGEETERGRVRPAEWQYEPSSPSEGEGDEEERRSNDANPQDDNTTNSQSAFRIPPPTSGSATSTGGGPPIPVQIPINATIPQADPRSVVGQDEDDFLSRQHQIASRFGLGGGNSGSSGGNSGDNTTTYTFRGGSWSTRASTTGAGRYLQYRFGSSPRYGETNSGSSSSAPQAPSNGTSTSTSTSSSEPSTSGPTSSNSAPQAPKKEAEEPKAQLSITRKHLAMTFSLLTRLACDIISKTHQKPKKIYDNSHETTIKLFKNIQESLRKSTRETFDWMFMVLDATEAKLRFNAQFLEHLGAQGDAAPAQAHDGRRDAFGYIFGLMRGSGADARDRLAEVDCEILETVGLVLDAYLVVEECGKQRRVDLKMLIDQFDDASRPRFKQQHSAVDDDLLCGFFRRPMSMQFVGDFYDGAWNTLWGRENMRMLRIEQDIPLVERPDMLSIDADHTAYFRPQEFEFLKMSKRKFLKTPTRCQMFYALQNSDLHQKQSIESQIKDHYQGILEHQDSPAPSQASEARPETGAVEKMRVRLQAEAQPIFSTYQKCVETIAQQHYDGICEALGNESSKSGLLQRIARFGVKHQQIIKAAEKYRSCHSNQKEVTLDVHRDQCQLVIETVIFLNQIYNRKLSATRGSDAPSCPLAGTRLRVRFIDEPGEGTGVTRSYYTALAEASMNLSYSPFDEIRRSDQEEMASSLNWQSVGMGHSTDYQQRNRKIRKEKAQRLRNSMEKLRTFSLNVNAPKLTHEKLVENLKKSGAENAEEMLKTIQEEAPKYVRNTGSNSNLSSRICSILCQLPPEYLRNCAENQDSLRIHIQQICVELRAEGEHNFEAENEPGPSQTTEGLDNIWAEIYGPQQGPLFVKSPNGYTYVPAPSGPNPSPVRLSAYRNIGRVMGICISQGDIFPLRFARHVFSYILRQPVSWLDFGFYDPEVFNSLRCLMCGNQEEEETFACATFSVDLMSQGDADSSQIVETIDLKPDGRNIPVTKENVTEYIYRYVDRVLLGQNLGALEAIREGILDVIPETMLAGLNPEDLKLILCGTEQICIETLQANTVFLDESRANSEILAKFKQSFWQVVESLSREEKQDLIFFWTGSASLPGEWQTNASVMLRPQEDMLLPTANTCISRLYVPVYSTKRILKSKLLMAIKAKNFGFV